MAMYPYYEAVKTVTDERNPKPYSLLETIETWNGPRTFIRQRGFGSIEEIENELKKRGKELRKF
jgi:hypothetical protein